MIAVLVVFLALYNNVIAVLDVPRWAYVPLNLTVAAGLIAFGRWRNLSWSDLGLGREGIAPGLRWGGAIAGVVLLGLAIALVVPSADRFLGDRRVAGLPAAGLAYTVLVRIPLGTVVLEEVAFRGVLFALWSRASSTALAVAASSVVFGLWHIGPTLDLLRTNAFRGGAWAQAGLVVGAVIGTAVGGALLLWLRIRTGGIVAPVVVHTAANSLATVAAYTSQRM